MSSTSFRDMSQKMRFVRLFAYGGSTLILVSFLSALEISKAKIGIFMTLTMIGDTIISFLCGYFADALGRRSILMAGSVLMVGAGIIFAVCDNFWVLLVAAVVGVISPNGTECGPFRAIEESTLAHLIKEEDRGDIYAWYSLLGGIGSACGLGICGLILHYLENLGWSTLKAYHTIFWGYSALGVAMLIIVLFLSKACELKNKPPLPASSSSSIIGSEDENKTPVTLKLPKFSQKSRVIVVKLCILFALDSFAVSLAPTSWITFFFHDKFALAENKLGTIFFATSFIAALSMLPASSLAKRFGNINTMVLAHLPGAIFLTLVPIPSSLSISTTFLIMRSITQSMDTAPRSAFMAGVVESHERTPMMSCVLVAKSSASSISPLIIGVLAGRGYLWVAFVAAGCLMCVYDCAFWVLFGRQIVNNKDSDVEKNASSGELGARGGFWSSAETLTNAGNKKKEASGAEERDASGDEKTEMSVGVTDVVADGSSVSSQIPVAHSEQKQ